MKDQRNARLKLRLGIMADNNTCSPDSCVTQSTSLENSMADSSSNLPAERPMSNPYNFCELNMSPDIVTQSFNITLKFMSPAASSGPFCRICHEGDILEDLVSLCKCSGSVGLVHLTCMERWLSSRRITRTGVDKCELCNFTFETIRSPRSITEWYQSDDGAISNKRSVLGDAACFSMITPLTALSSFLCFEGAKQHVAWNNSLEAGCLMALATFLITIYLVWNVLTIRYHLKSYFKWRSVNQNVRLVHYRRKCSNRASTNDERQEGSEGNPVTGDSLSEQLVTSNDQTTPNSIRLQTESVDTSAQASNAYT